MLNTRCPYKAGVVASNVRIDDKIYNHGLSTDSPGLRWRTTPSSD